MTERHREGRASAQESVNNQEKERKKKKKKKVMKSMPNAKK